MSRINSDDSAIECDVRDKYAKRWKESEASSYFQLYTTYSKPGLVSIFYNEDQRSFHNWGLEVGSGPKRGRIREPIDHQINTPVLEIAGHHDGSVYMVCPPDPNQTINVDMPYLTILMRDMHGYSSVEFTVLDTLGFSRKICAKNFKSRCTIGELNCEIPMRLSPTWNYACVNLDDTLRNAFGTKLVSVQRIKINANVRVRRIYFHDEIFPFKSLTQEFRIKLMLTPQEKQEIHMYEEFLLHEPTTNPERNTPWSMPRLMITKPSAIHNALRMSTANVLYTAAHRRRRVKIMEVPLKEEDSDKYTNISGIHAPSNSGLLKEMLLKSIPPSKVLLPTLSLIYPDNKAQGEAAAVQSGKVEEYLKKKGHKENKFFKREISRDRDACGDTIADIDEKTDHLRKMKRCIEVLSPREDVQDENGNSSLPSHGQTDWEKFHSHGHHDQSGSQNHQRSNSPEPTDASGGESPRSEHYPHHSHGSCKHTVADLVQYLKYRETFGDYDMFSGKVGNTKFLMVPGGETMEETNSDSESEQENQEEKSGEDGKSVHGESPFFLNELNSTPSRKSSGLTSVRQSTMSRFIVQDPAKVVEEETTPSATESRLSSHQENSIELY